MPTYEYKCNACGHKFEKFQSIMAAPIKKCPHCGKSAVQRLIGTGAGLIFKGSGFYITDYRSEGYKEKAKAEGGGDSKKTDGGASTESKPAEKKESPTPAKAAEGKAKSSQKPPSKSADKKSS